MFLNSVSHYLPETYIPNSHFIEKLGVSDEWIVKRSGIKTRTKASKFENTNTMGLEAVNTSIPSLPYKIEEIDLIISATYTPYDTIGTLAHFIQGHYNISNAICFSITSACSSFINAAEIVEAFFQNGKASKALIITAEHNSIYNNEDDKQSGYLWGDGAAATFFSKEKYSEKDFEIIDIHSEGLGNIGKGVDGVSLRPNEGGMKMPYGKDVFLHASKYMLKEATEILIKNNLTLNDLNYLIPHQANIRIINNVAENMGLSENQVLLNITEIGNTGCASSVIAFSQNIKKFKSNDKLLFSVFGGGYSSGSMLLKKI
ncbi:MAG: ketoacyl-ACP synthase III [Bacteroidetes bacterium]|nr:ketoacyl-ACP synthase III [Bacteroidota bacterium]